jgi:phage shock protein A
MSTFLKIGAAVAVTLVIVYRRSLMGWLGAGTGAGKSAGTDPLARYQQKIDEAGDTLKQAKTGLDRCRTVINSLGRQVADGERDVARLDTRIKTALSEGNEDRAAEYVQQLQTARATLEENRRQLDTNREIYNSFLKQVQAAQDRIVQAKRDADSMGTRLQTSQAEADLADITRNLDVDSHLVGSEADREAALQQVDAATARVQTAQDLSAATLGEIEEDERSRKVDARTLLDQYKANMPNSPEPHPPS